MIMKRMEVNSEGRKIFLEYVYLCGHPNPSGKFCEIACGRLEASDIIVKVESTSTYRTTTSKLEFRKGKYPVGLGYIHT